MAELEDRFSALLTLAQYGGDSAPAKIKWAARLKNAPAIISFLCDHVTRQNVLSSEEMAAFRGLEKEGKVVKNSSELRRLLLLQKSQNNGGAAGEKEESSESLRVEVDVLREQLGRIRQDRARVEERKKSVANEVRWCRERWSLLKQSVSPDNSGGGGGALGSSLASRVSGINAQVNARLMRVAHLSSRLVHLHVDRVERSKTLLSWCSVEEYAAQEGRVTSEAKLVLERGLFNNGGNAAELQARRNQEERNQQQLEVARLQNAYIVSGMAKLLAEVDMAKIEARKQQPSHQKMSKEEIRGLLASLKKDYSQRIESVRELLDEVAQIRSSKVLLVDYTTKLKQHKHRLERLSWVLTFLEAQRDRMGSVFAALQEEKTHVKHCAALLQSICEELEGSKAQYVTRMMFLESCKQEKDVTSSGALESLMRALNAALKGRFDSQDLLTMCTALSEAAAKGREARKANDEAAWQSLMQMEKHMQRAKEILLPDPRIEIAEKNAQKSAVEASEYLAKFEKQRLDFEADLRSRHPDILAVERAIMSLFWENPQDPARLNATLAKLKEKLGLTDNK